MPFASQLPIPSYIAVANPSPRQDYRWNEEKPFSNLISQDETIVQELQHKISEISNFGIVAFALGSAEWVLYGLCESILSPLAAYYQEALWMVLSGKFSGSIMEADETAWRGRVNGPVMLSLMTTLNTLLQSEFGTPVKNATIPFRVALHVLAASDPFLQWQAGAVARLIKAYPRNQNDPDGPPVSRLVLDPSVNLDIAVNVDAKEAVFANFVKKNNPLLS